MVWINGEPRDAAGQTVAQCLAEMAGALGRVAVERNGEIVPRDRYTQTVLADGDRVEVVRFVGGG